MRQAFPYLFWLICIQDETGMRQNKNTMYRQEEMN